MYKIIGADGKQYGPISIELLRRWISERRVDSQTRVQGEGSTEWKAAAAIPELADLLSSQAPPPFAATPPKPDPEVIVTEVMAANREVKIGDCISRSWNLMMEHFWLIVGASFVLHLIQGAVGLLTGVCVGGLYYLMLKLIRGQRAEFGDAFAGFSTAFLPLFLVGLVSGLLSGLGFLCFVLPGIYLAVAWTFALPLVIDKKLEFWPAMEVSRRIVTRHWWTLFGLILLNVLVICVGIACCLVGMFVAIPLTFGALAYAYEDLFGNIDGFSKGQNPPVPT